MPKIRSLASPRIAAVITVLFLLQITAVQPAVASTQSHSGSIPIGSSIPTTVQAANSTACRPPAGPYADGYVVDVGEARSLMVRGTSSVPYNLDLHLYTGVHGGCSLVGVHNSPQSDETVVIAPEKEAITIVVVALQQGVDVGFTLTWSPIPEPLEVEPEPTPTPKPLPPPKSVQATLFVSPDGSGDTCTERSPCSLDDARAQVRTMNDSMVGDIVVSMRGGTYHLEGPIQLDSSDSGSNGFDVVYRAYGSTRGHRYRAGLGERPILDGGRHIQGWSLVDAERGIWSAPAGLTDENLDAPRQLWVDGLRAVRARTASAPSGFRPTRAGYAVTNPAFVDLVGTNDLEVVAFNSWKSFRCGVAAVIPGAFVMDQPCWNNSQLDSAFPMKEPGWVENARAFMDEPGEWWYDGETDELLYMPRPGEDLTTADVVIPVAQALVVGAGTLDEPVQSLRFEGLTFSYATWAEPSGDEGFVPLQADIRVIGHNLHISQIAPPEALVGAGPIARQFEKSLAKTPAAVRFRAAHGITFEGSTFKHLGMAGISFDGGSQRNTVLGNRFDDTSGSAVQVGSIHTDDHHPSDKRMTTAHNLVSDNVITRAGAEYHGSVGIFSAYTDSTRIEHNELSDLPYTAISDGWGWGAHDPQVGIYGTPTTLKNGRIVGNRMWDYMKLMEDGGGIYAWSAHPGLMIVGNVVERQRNEYGALYFDDFARFFQAYGNVVFDNRRTALLKGTEHQVINNFWQDRYRDDIWNRTTAPTVFDNNKVVNDSLVMPASIINAAGLREAYHFLRDAAPPGDATAPTAPGQPVALSVGPTSVELAWTAASDDVGVTGYEIHLNGALVDVSYSGPYLASGLTPGTTYCFAVAARDAAANLSPMGAELCVTTSSEAVP